MKRITLFLLAIFLAISFSYAQTVTPQLIGVTSGTYNDASSYFRADWSVGETAVTTIATPLGGGATYVITQGFLQPYVNNFDVNHAATFGDEEIRVFPNPATSYVEINFKTKQKGQVTFHLYNAVGQRFYSKSFTSYGLDRIEKIEMERQAAGTYVLYIELEPELGSRPKKGSYKIIKLR
jgi:hypothetical protein